MKQKFSILLAMLVVFAFASCDKTEDATSPTAQIEKKGGVPAGGNGNGNNPNNPPPPNYVLVEYDNYDFNFQWDTLTCGHLHITWDTPSTNPRLRTFLKHTNLTGACYGSEVVGGDVLLNYLGMACSSGFLYGTNTYDAFMLAYYQEGDTTWQWTSPTQPLTTGEFPYWYSVAEQKYVCGPIQ